ncbi:MAG: twin-arginine translocation signal domain-containing protein, partial [Acidobacteriota bacterium]
MYLSRREFVQYAAVTGLAAPLSAARLAAESSSAGQSPGTPYAPPPAFELEEITIPQLQDGLKSGKYTSR